MAALNIKNEEAVRLAKELADLEGKSQTTVVIEALREKLERERKLEVHSAGLAARLLEIGHSTAPLWREPCLSITHGDLLYDEYGLPM